MRTRSQTQTKPTPKPSFTPVRSGLLQRKCACGNSASLTGKCTECENKRLTLQRRSTDRAEASEVPPIVHEVLREPDQSLNASSLTLMNSRFGHDFSQLQVYIDKPTGKSVQTLSLGSPKGGLGHSVASERVVEKRHFQNMGVARKAENLQLTAYLKIERPTLKQRAAVLSDTGEADVEALEDGVIRKAQAAGGGGAGAGGAAPTCTYAVDYANLSTVGCDSGKCGAKISYDVTGVRATGSGCPSSLDGLRLTETVTTNNGCGPGSVTTGSGCPIRSHPPMLPNYGQITGCTDTYTLCASPAYYPATGCTERYTQQLFVGGNLAETRTITFRITKSSGSCSGTVTRT
ncbi:hypothetical protein [Microseira wollei]|uniref:Uncharacterized protein n=1 Tax=Microseira wollei NIES-4236 TaxID=2530354 RepID=A0AAV3XBL7_9CYAN|nr:hypothetical protein [Microseira wollei]GET39215.1 hypothetical protein MiSe_39790 [Microseira wollei NIES-4236]